MKMLCTDLLREISKYLMVKDCLALELAVQEKLYDVCDYKMRFYREPYTTTCGVFMLRSYFDKRFQCNIKTKDHQICLISMYQVQSTREACQKAIELFKLDH